ncbi:hypothetical protein BC830DRAFT_1083026 [Chytriomyces sp. MP71]|nr:hypothetical protein BC830DRAFT_1083026 [Chytriomyces sp. MP71]
MQCTKRYRSDGTNAMMTCGQECARCMSGPQAKTPGKQFWRCPTHGFFAWAAEVGDSVDVGQSLTGPTPLPIPATLLASGVAPRQPYQPIPRPHSAVQVDANACDPKVDTALGAVSAAAEAVFADNNRLKEVHQKLLLENTRLKTKILETKERMKAFVN